MSLKMNKSFVSFLEKFTFLLLKLRILITVKTKPI